MPYIVNHIHLKSEDPKLTADWFVKAFNVEIVSDRVRIFGRWYADFYIWSQRWRRVEFRR